MGNPAAPPTTTAPTHQPVVRRWPCSARSVRPARHQLADVLDGWDLGHLTDPAVLVLSELLGNAVRHARAPRDRLVETRYERTPEGVLIEVHDADKALPVLRKPSVEAESGRGLVLVDTLTAGRWGVAEREGVGKRTWAVIADDGVGRGAAAWEGLAQVFGCGLVHPRGTGTP